MFARLLHGGQPLNSSNEIPIAVDRRYRNSIDEICEWFYSIHPSIVAFILLSTSKSRVKLQMIKLIIIILSSTLSVSLSNGTHDDP